MEWSNLVASSGIRLQSGHPTTTRRWTRGSERSDKSVIAAGGGNDALRRWFHIHKLRDGLAGGLFVHSLVLAPDNGRQRPVPALGCVGVRQDPVGAVVDR